MILTLKRIILLEDRTIGELYIDGEFFCDTLEDKNRDTNKNGNFDNEEQKIYGETCIPYGEYKVELTYSPKFKRVLPILQDVPGFSGIRIHRGNYIKDTLGCILVGERSKDNILVHSTPYEIKLVEILKNTQESITIKII
jgi:hypothetical protein